MRSGLDWRLPAWANGLMQLFTLVLNFAGGVALGFGCTAAVPDPIWVLAAFVLVFVLIEFSVAIHECGHLLLGRFAGMTVVLMQVGWVQLQAQRTGWRWRWTKSRLKAAGYVIAYPDPQAPIRRQRLLLAAGGPLANLVAGCVAGAIGHALGWQRASLPLYGFATFNVLYGISNLLPKEGGLASDGLNIVRWLIGVPEDDPRVGFQRIEGMSLAGVTADRIPRRELDSLARSPMPMPWFHLWYSLKGHQNRGEWNEAVALEGKLAGLMAATAREMGKAIEDLVAIIRCELDFSQAMIDGSAVLPIDRALRPNNDWFSPGLRPRCRALQAALAGDGAGMRANLDASEGWARRSIDRALETSEATIRTAIRARLAPEGGGLR
jgi:hypothetical protein